MPPASASPIAPPLLILGSVGPAVAAWRSSLMSLGYGGSVGDVYDSPTVALTRRLQADGGVTVDGEVGTDTRRVAARMLARIVPKVRTPMLDAALVDVVRAAHVAATGTAPSRTRLVMLTAMLGCEHGTGADTTAPANGRALWSCYAWDIGNRRYPTSYTGACFAMTAEEIIAGHAQLVPGVWPAYPTAIEGATTWITLLATKYRMAFAASNTGSAWAFAGALKATGYYTASVTAYAVGVATWQRHFDAIVPR